MGDFDFDDVDDLIQDAINDEIGDGYDQFEESWGVEEGATAVPTTQPEDSTATTRPLPPTYAASRLLQRDMAQSSVAECSSAGSTGPVSRRAQVGAAASHLMSSRIPASQSNAQGAEMDSYAHFAGKRPAPGSQSQFVRPLHRPLHRPLLQSPLSCQPLCRTRCLLSLDNITQDSSLQCNMRDPGTGDRRFTRVYLKATLVPTRKHQGPESRLMQGAHIPLTVNASLAQLAPCKGS